MTEIEYFYSAHSAYANIGSARFMETARAANRRIAHKPMDLRKVVAITGPGPTNSLITTGAGVTPFSLSLGRRWFRAGACRE